MAISLKKVEGTKEEGEKVVSNNQVKIRRKAAIGRTLSNALLAARWGIMPTSVCRGREQKITKLKTTTEVHTSHGTQAHLQLTELSK